MRTKIIVLLWLTVMCSGSVLWGWGAGHNDVQKLINKNLPTKIAAHFTPDQLKKLEKHYSHYPDSFAKFDKAEVGEYALKILKELKVNKRYDLHRVKGRTAAFKLLVESFKRKDYARSIIWMGALGHALADEAASNHDPIIHYVTYHLWMYKLDTGTDVKLRKFRKWLDVYATARDPEGKKIFYSSLKNHRPKTISPDPQATIIDINVKADCVFPNLMGQQGCKILRGIKNGAINGDSRSSKKLFAVMTELGSVPAAYTIDIIYTADAYASKGTKVEFDQKSLFKTIRAKEVEYINTKPLNCGLYMDNFDFKQRNPKLGIIIEPFYSFNHGQISSLWKYVAPALARKLTEQKIAYQVIDLRDIIKNGFPDPKQLPVCIFSAGGYNGYKGLSKKQLEQAFADYVAKGGKLIWIGGLNISKALGMDRYLKKVGGKIDGKYHNYSGIANDEIANGKLGITKDFSPQLAGKYSFVNNPQTPAGWCKPSCQFVLKKHDTLYMTLDHNGKKIAVAGKFGNIIFIPEYAISPYLFDNKYNLKELDRPSLGKFSSNILLTAIRKFIKDN
jgi:hypothetical protein